MSLPNRNVMECSVRYKNVTIVIEDKAFLADLMQLDLSEFDVILGMK